MPVIDLLGPHYPTENKVENNRQLINFYLEEDQFMGKYKVIAKPTPGLTAFSSASGSNVRALIEHEGQLYAVVDGDFVHISSAGVRTVKGSLNSSVLPVDWAAIDDEIVLVDGNRGYSYKVSTDNFAAITDLDFPTGAEVIASLDGRFVTFSPNSNTFQISELNDGRTWEALSQAQAGSRRDRIVSIRTVNQELMVMGEYTIEPWYNSGNVDFTFQRRPGTVVEYGCSAGRSATTTTNTVYWVGRAQGGGHVVFRLEGYTPKVISTRAISQRLSELSTVADCFAYSYLTKGHEFIVFTFPTDKETLVYDVSTEMWFKWESQNLLQEQSRHRSNCFAYCYGKYLIGDYESANVYELDYNAFTDAGRTIEREIITSPFSQENKMLTAYNFDIDVERGKGALSGQGLDPEIMLQVNKDNRGFGNITTRATGIAGEYNRRARWSRLGSARDWSFRIRVSDPVYWCILGCVVDFDLGDT